MILHYELCLLCLSCIQVCLALGKQYYRTKMIRMKYIQCWGVRASTHQCVQVQPMKRLVSSYKEKGVQGPILNVMITTYLADNLPPNSVAKLCKVMSCTFHDQTTRYDHKCKINLAVFEKIFVLMLIVFTSNCFRHSPIPCMGG